MKRVLVTGGAGFIGHHLVRALARRHAVIVVDNLSNTNQNSAKAGPGVAFYREDVRNAETMSDIVKRERIDTCVHLAAKVSVADSVRNPAETTSVNVMGTFSVLEACAANHVDKFILASSAAVYGNPARVPVSEDHALTPLSPYGASKVAAEALAASFTNSGKIKSAISLRFFNVYGPGEGSQYSGVITKIAQRLSEGLPPIIYGDGRQTRDFISVGDAVDAVMLAANKQASGAFNIGTGKPVSVNKLAAKMIALSGLKVKPLHREASEGDILHSCADTRKAARLLGFRAKGDLDLGFIIKR